MSILDKILELLNDGRWHNIEEIAEKLNLNTTTTQKITHFLAQYDLIQLDKDHRNAKLTPKSIKLLTKTQNDNQAPKRTP